MTREDVISWLEYLSDDARSKADSLVPTNIEIACGMAIDALKAQEPRVMTLEEYDAWTDLPFTERNPVFHEERTKRGSVTCWTNTAVCSLREYGKNDRCWTSRPTVEQMEATSWNAQK